MQRPGFRSSWRLLTREEGWFKPVMLLTLVSWIPVLGQIAMLGYGLEWARLTAWGLDAAPKRRGVNYAKLLRSGCIAFAVSLCMMIMVAFVEALAPVGHHQPHPVPMAGFGLGSGMALVDSSMWLHDAPRALVITGSSLLELCVGLIVGTFILAAAMRAVLYDGFGAGWRLDRLCQMIARDPRGFARSYLTALAGSLAVGALAWISMALLTGIGVAGTMGLMAAMNGAVLIEAVPVLGSLLTGIGPLALLALVLLSLVIAFSIGMLSVALQLTAINAMGQWFRGFDVARWGVSADPLPDGVPVG